MERKWDAWITLLVGLFIMAVITLAAVGGAVWAAAQ